MALRVLFMGTPHYAVVIADGLSKLSDMSLRVVTQPDARVGRGYRLRASPVAVWAEEHGIEVDRPHRLNAMREAWEGFSPDLVITAAYGKILPPWMLALPRLGALNVHASLLPRWRGPNPIAWAIRAGDVITGVTLMSMDQGIDTGPVYGQRAVSVDAAVDMGGLTDVLALAGRDLLVELLPDILAGRLGPTPQESTGMTTAPKFSAEETKIPWQVEAFSIARLIRSMSPSPAAYTMFRGRRLQILSAEADPKVRMRPAAIAMDRNGALVGTGTEALRLCLVRPEGKRAMTGIEWARGIRLGEQEYFA